MMKIKKFKGHTRADETPIMIMITNDAASADATAASPFQLPPPSDHTCKTETIIDRIWSGGEMKPTPVFKVKKALTSPVKCQRHRRIALDKLSPLFNELAHSSIKISSVS